MTPITDFLTAYAHAGFTRFHMPGHKGAPPESFPAFLRAACPYDLTEIKGADELYEPEGIIARSEGSAAALYGSGWTAFSAGGSTLCILTMVAAALRAAGTPEGGEVIAARNAHLSFVNACVHVGAKIRWLMPPYDRETGLCLPVTAGDVAAAMDMSPAAKVVYITSPDYYGVEADVKGIAEVVRARGGLLLVDNAHGAHLTAFPGRHPMEAGADLCCDSPHKTLPVLTGGSLLHCRAGMEAVFPKESVKRLMTLYGSTSPSYLIMASLEQAVNWMAGEGKAAFRALETRWESLKTALLETGLPLLPRVTDPTKITIDAYGAGYTADELAESLRAAKMEPEYAGGGKVVLMLSPQTPGRDYDRLLGWAKTLPKRPAIPYPDAFIAPEPAMTPREAFYRESELQPVAECLGRIAAETRITCPPGVPVVVAGEKIGESEKKLLLDSGIFSLNVLK